MIKPPTCLENQDRYSSRMLDGVAAGVVCGRPLRRPHDVDHHPNWSPGRIPHLASNGTGGWLGLHRCRGREGDQEPQRQDPLDEASGDCHVAVRRLTVPIAEGSCTERRSRRWRCPLNRGNFTTRHRVPPSHSQTDRRTGEYDP